VEIPDVVKHRILPIMRKAREQHSDYFEMSFIWINVRSDLFLRQVDVECCVWEDTSKKQANQRSRLSVRDVVPWSTVGGGRIDVSLLATKLLEKSDRKGVAENTLMGLLEVKKSIQSHEYKIFVSQTVCYMASPLSFSRWGMLKKDGTLVALLISPTILYPSLPPNFIQASGCRHGAAGGGYIKKSKIQRTH
jgi:hypothetical protein